MNRLARIRRHPWALLLGMGPLLGCQSTAFLPEGRHPAVRVLDSVPADKPAWLDKTPAPSEGSSFFVGNSNYAASETEARDLALDAALKNAAVFVGVQLDGELQGVRRMNHDASKVADPAIQKTEHWVGKTSAYFSRFQPEQWFVQQLERNWGRGVKERSFSASVLLSIPTEVVEAAIAEAEQQRRQARFLPEASLRSSPEGGPKRGAVQLADMGSSRETSESTGSCCCGAASPRSSRPNEHALEEPLHGRLSVPRAIAKAPPSTPERALEGTHRARLVALDQPSSRKDPATSSPP